MTKLLLKVNLSDSQFYQVCQDNSDLQFERQATGELIIMSPSGGETSRRNLNLALQVALWNEKSQLGVVFDSSGGFRLPNGANRAPDVSWVAKPRWDRLTSEEKEKFPPLCPDFVIELLSPTDNLKETQAKMQEYLDNGCELGWLINRKKQEVEIYRSGINTQVLLKPLNLTGEKVLPGFVLNLEPIWE